MKTPHIDRVTFTVPCNKCRFRFCYRRARWLTLTDVYFWRCRRCDALTWCEARKFWGRPL